MLRTLVRRPPSSILLAGVIVTATLLGTGSAGAREPVLVSLNVGPKVVVVGEPVFLSAGLGRAAPDPMAPKPSGHLHFSDVSELTLLSDSVLDADAFASATASFANPGEHHLRADYQGDGTYAGGSSEDQVVVVSRADTATSISASSEPSVFGQPVTFTASVAISGPGHVDEIDGAVAFYDGPPDFDNLLASTVLLNGVSSFTTSSLSTGTHHISAVYEGDQQLFGSGTRYTHEVAKAPSTTTLTATPPGSVALGKPATFTATVAVPPPGAGRPTGSVTFSVDGHAVTTSPLSASLRAEFSTRALTPGTHIVTAEYSGDANFENSRGRLQYVVSCTQTITGTHAGAIIASGASVCVVDATVGGGIVVTPGTSLAVIHSTIGGAISATNTPGSVAVCSSAVVGSVNVVAAAGLVMVGDPNAVCSPNTIRGTLLLRNNVNGVVAVDNAVGNVVASGNSGPGGYPGEGTTISGNHHW